MGIAWIIDLQSCLLNGIAWIIDLQSCLLNGIAWITDSQSRPLNGIAWIIDLQSCLPGILDNCHHHYAAIDCCLYNRMG